MTEQDHRRSRLVDLPDAGFSLVEAIVAMVLLALVALAMVPVLATGARTAANNREMSKAAQYVATELETAQQMTCAQVRAAVFTGNGFVSPPDATGSDGVARAFSQYTLRDAYTDTPGGICISGQTYRLTATATLDGTSQQVTATTLVLVP